jgi:hypothetical protein
MSHGEARRILVSSLIGRMNEMGAVKVMAAVVCVQNGYSDPKRGSKECCYPIWF